MANIIAMIEKIETVIDSADPQQRLNAVRNINAACMIDNLSVPTWKKHSTFDFGSGKNTVSAAQARAYFADVRNVILQAA